MRNIKEDVFLVYWKLTIMGGLNCGGGGEILGAVYPYFVCLYLAVIVFIRYLGETLLDEYTPKCTHVLKTAANKRRSIHVNTRAML